MKQTQDSDSDSSDDGPQGIKKQLKTEIISLYHQSQEQTDFENDAEFIKQRLDAMFKPFWFVFIWHNDFNHDIKFAYNDADNRFFEFKYHNHTVLVYQFITRDPQKEHKQYPKPSYPNRFYYPPDFYFDEYYDPYLYPPYPYPNPTIQRNPIYHKTHFI